jgi:hypothetical protein
MQKLSAFNFFWVNLFALVSTEQPSALLYGIHKEFLQKKYFFAYTMYYIFAKRGRNG